MAGKLARIRWEMGQSLLPDHFIGLEESLETHIILRHRFHGLPDYGVAGLQWNTTLLTEGVFSIRSATIVMPSGLLLDVPANAQLSPFNLNVPGSVNVPVYLHVVQETATGQQMPTRGAGPVDKVIHQIVLSSEQSYTDALETLKIGEFEKSPEGKWMLSGAFLPPLLQIGTSPFLQAELNELKQSLDLFDYHLTQEMTASYLSGDSLTSAKQCLKGVYRMQRFLANLDHQIHCHPYFVYEALKEFYTEVCFYKNAVPEHLRVPYDCNQLGQCFAHIFNPLINLLRVAQQAPPYFPFELQDNVYRATLPRHAREAKEIYFLVQKDHVGAQVPIHQYKLACLDRLPLVHKLSLQGVVLKKINRPPFQHNFGPEVDFYLIGQCEELSHVLRALTVGFYQNRQLEKMKYYLYWRFD